MNIQPEALPLYAYPLEFSEEGLGMTACTPPLEGPLYDLKTKIQDITRGYREIKTSEDVRTITQECFTDLHALQNLTEGDIGEIKEDFRTLFVYICSLPNEISWGQEVVDQFDFTLSDIYNLVQRPYQNLQTQQRCYESLHFMRFPETTRIELARQCLLNQFPLSEIIHRFQLSDETCRKEFALLELRQLQALEHVSKCFHNFRITNPIVRDEIAQHVAEVHPKGWIQNWQNFEIESEELRLKLFKKTAPRHPCDDAWTDVLQKALTSPQHRLELCLILGPHTMSEAFIRAVPTFGFSQDTLEHFFVQLSETNPALLFEHWDALLLSPELKNRLKALNPFFPLKDLLSNVHEQLGTGFPSLQAPLQDLLQRISALNQRYGLPFLFTFSENESSLYSLIKKISSLCSDEDLLKLLHLIKSHFFITSDLLLTPLIVTLNSRHPHISQYIQLEKAPLQSIHHIPRPFFNPSAVSFILNEKLERKPVANLMKPIQVCEIDSLPTKIQELIQTGTERALLAIHFPQVGYHFSPCILERDVTSTDKLRRYKVLFSDSVSSTYSKYFLFIFKTLLKHNLPLKMYSTTTIRQFDPMSCSVFTLNDLFWAMKVWRQGEHISAIDTLRDSGIPHYSFIESYVLFQPELQKLTQSLNALSPSAEEELMQKGQRTTLGAYARAHTYVFYDLSQEGRGFRQGNFAARQKFCTYIERVVRASLHP